MILTINLKDDTVLKEEMRKLARESLMTLAREDAAKIYEEEFTKVVNKRITELNTSTYMNIDTKIQQAISSIVKADLEVMKRQDDGSYKYDIAVQVEKYLQKTLPQAIDRHVNVAVIKKELLKVLEKLS